MKLLNMKYAIFFNKKYRFVGQLMQGRFRAEAVEDDGYFLALNRYIHLNPVEAGIVLHPKDYQWSSYNAYEVYAFRTLVELVNYLQGKLEYHPPVLSVTDRPPSGKDGLDFFDVRGQEVLIE